MSTRLVTDGIWSLLTRAAKANTEKAHVAVAYFAKGASRLLPLTEGSRLVVDLSERAVKSGQTCPADILKLIRAGVEVFSVPNLHAKVFVFPKTAVIGSANASQSSAQTLVEAAVVTEDRRLIAEMRRFVNALCLDRITLHEGKRLERLYRPPAFIHSGTRARPRSRAKLSRTGTGAIDVPSVRVVQLLVQPWDEDERIAQRTGTRIARGRLRDSKHFRVDCFHVSGRCRYQAGELVLQVTDDGAGKRWISPPAKVVHLQPVSNRRPKGTVVCIEAPRWLRRKGLEVVVQRLGDEAALYLGKDNILREQGFIQQLLGLWAATKRRKP